MSSTDLDELLDRHASRDEPETEDESPIEWLLVHGDRLLIAGVLVLLTAVVVFALGQAGVIAVDDDDAVTRMSGGMIAGTFSLITIVLTINQVILSSEFRTAMEAEEQLDGVHEFYKDVQTMTGVERMPSTTSTLFRAIVQRIADCGRTIASAADRADDDLAPTLDRYGSSIASSADRTAERFDAADFGTVNAVAAAIGYDDDWQLVAAHQLEAVEADRLPEDAAEALTKLVELLRLLEIAVSHFKTTYLQRELAHVSRLVLYTGIPAVLAAIGLGLVYAASPGAALPDALLLPVASVLIAVVLAPLYVLASYTLRAATIARRTAAIAPVVVDD